MREVVVASEFTRMNTGMNRRPFKVLTPSERSTAMVIARYSTRQVAGGALPAQAEQHDLVWKALRMGIACAGCAFAFFFLSQRNLLERTGEALGALPDSIQRVNFKPLVATLPSDIQTPDGKAVSTDTAPQPFTVPEDKDFSVTQFNLSVTSEFQNVGDVQLRLNNVNTTANTYDITVKTSQREFYRQDVKLNERIQLAKNSTAGSELVIGAIAHDRVFGYLSEPLRRGHRRHHRR